MLIIGIISVIILIVTVKPGRGEIRRLVQWRIVVLVQWTFIFYDRRSNAAVRCRLNFWQSFAFTWVWKDNAVFIKPVYVDGNRADSKD